MLEDRQRRARLMTSSTYIKKMLCLIICLLPQLSYPLHAQPRLKRNVFQPIKDGVWSEWSKWSPCSRSCDGGVSSRTRHCFPPSTMSFRGRGLEPVDDERCRGKGKDLKLCSMHRCPSASSGSFRDEQCAKFNHIPYQGKYYTWESVENKESFCSLDCQASKKSDILTRMADKVIDGTRCRQNSLDVCIDGECVKVGCDLKLNSDKILDACGVCGGKGQSCSSRTSIFIWKETPLSHCSVPCGGGFMMARPVCINDITKEKVLDDLCDSTLRPKERMAPCNQDPCPPRWEVDDWKSCSKSCGGGVKERNVSCIIDEKSEKVVVSESQCLDLKPPSKEGCNTHQCPQWFTGLWSDCSVTCGKGSRHRNVICRDERGLPSGACDYSIRPAVTQLCYHPCPESEYKRQEVGGGWIKLNGDESGYSLIEEEQGEINIDDEETEVSESERNSSNYDDSVAPIPPQKLLQVSSISPTFIVEKWEACSSPCGEGIRKRKVECKIFLEFSKTIAILPDKECPGPKPPETEVCYSGLCGEGSVINNVQRDIENTPRRSSYSWKDSGFTSCSESCLGGIQESKIICVEDELETPVAPNNCPVHTRPEVIVRTCNDHPCPPRWNVSEFSECSKSCGGGIQIRTVSCIQEVRHGGNNILKVNDSFCPQPPPITQQFCNVLDCPVKWTTTSWTKCSSSCGGGYKFRKVRCQQLLALGEMADKPEVQCPGRKPEEQKLCNPQNCPEVTGIYSQHHYEKDHVKHQNQMKKHGHSHNHRKEEKEVRMPSIKANLNQNYVQSDPSKRTVKLKVGGKATVYLGTKLKIRCPVKKFDRKKLQWSFGNSLIKPLSEKSKKEKRTTNVFVTKKGGLRIKKINFSDEGIYTCLAKGSTATIELIVKRKPSVLSNDSIKWKKFGNNKTNPYISSKNQYEDFDQDLKKTTEPPGWDPHRLWVDETTTPPTFFSSTPRNTNNLYMRFNTIQSKKQKGWNLIGNKDEYYDWESDISSSNKKESSYNSVLDDHSSSYASSSSSSSSTTSSSLSFNLTSLLFLILVAQYYFNRKRHLNQDYMDPPEFVNDRESDVTSEPDSPSAIKLEWETSSWSPCSQTCGLGGKQNRRVNCVVIQNNNRSVIPEEICVDSGLKKSKPKNLQNCAGNQPCPKWLADPWPRCREDSKCISKGKGLQTRSVKCGFLSRGRKKNEHSNLDDKFCEAILRPKSSRTCNNPNCEGIWHTGEWSKCSITCGKSGIRLRKVNCYWKSESADPVDESLCEMKASKPVSKEICYNASSCTSSSTSPLLAQTSGVALSSHIKSTKNLSKDCKDESKYCGLVQSFKLCNLPKYSDKCCYSCSLTPSTLN